MIAKSNFSIIVITIFILTSCKVSNCGPISWQHGEGDEKANQLLKIEFARIGLETKVESSSYGEGTTCGGYLPMDYAFIITIYNLRDSSQTYLEQTSKEVVDILYKTFKGEIEHYQINYLFTNDEISCSWGINHVYPDKTDRTNTCIFGK